MNIWQQFRYRIALLTLVYFAPVALLVGGFFYFTLVTFSGTISNFDELLLAEEVLWDESGAMIVVSDAQQLGDYQDSAVSDVYAEEFAAYVEPVEMGVYNNATTMIWPVFIMLLMMVFVLSVIAAYITVRPLAQSLDRQRRFIADASHELKTPIALLRSEIELFDRKESPAPGTAARTLIDNVSLDIARVSRVIEQLLLVARSESHTQQAQSAGPSELDAVTTTSIRRFEKSAPTHTITQTGTHAHTLPITPDSYQTVLDSLLENTCAHTPAGTQVTVHIGGDKHTTTLSVSDTGPGVSPQHRAHLFDRFYRVQESRTNPGTGLGLSIVHDSVTAAGGEVAAHETPGGGLTITCTWKGVGSHSILSD